ncbi:hypothetical protein AGMMS50268_23680 [Spirochaetia bacterium]|nr:hypothetical protein AGMMS50268_23680 [Spirochaetia bacterium]
MDDLGFFPSEENIYPGLEDSEITKAIEDLEKEYARLIDTYPVN